MEKIGIVKEIHDGNIAIVETRMDNACSEKCELCGICEKHMNEIEALNNINAKIGDKVKINSDNKYFLLYAFLVFILPIILPLFSYLFFIMFFTKLITVIFTITGFLLAVLFIFIVNNKIKNKIEDIIIEIL